MVQCWRGALNHSCHPRPSVYRYVPVCNCAPCMGPRIYLSIITEITIMNNNINKVNLITSNSIIIMNTNSQLTAKLVQLNHNHIFRASCRTICLFWAELFVLLPATWSVSAAPILPQVREFLVWLLLNSGTTYLSLYDLATQLLYLKTTWKLICSIRHLPPDSTPIHCDPSLNACLDSRACNVDVNLT